MARYAPPTDAEPDGALCAARSGHGADAALTERLIAEVRGLRTALTWRASRTVPGQFAATVTSCLPDDPAAIGRRAR